jgi:hypothetical protein
MRWQLKARYRHNGSVSLLVPIPVAICAVDHRGARLGIAIPIPTQKALAVRSLRPESMKLDRASYADLGTPIHRVPIADDVEIANRDFVSMVRSHRLRCSKFSVRRIKGKADDPYPNQSAILCKSIESRAFWMEQTLYDKI